MLKIKESIDLKELKKFDYYKLDNCDNYQKDLEHAPIPGSWVIRTITKSIYIKNRVIYYCHDNTQDFATADNPYIQDIIKSDIIEEVND